MPPADRIERLAELTAFRNVAPQTCRVAMLRRLLLCLLLGFSSCCCDSACRRSVLVRVTGEDSEPIAGATVQIDELCCSAGRSVGDCIKSTDEKGVVRHEIDHMSECTLVVSAAGWATKTQKLDAPGCDHDVRLDVTLSKEAR